MGHLQYIHLGVILQNLIAGVGAVLLVELGEHAHVGGDHNDVRLIADLSDGVFHGQIGSLVGALLNALLAAVPDGNVRGDDADDGQLHAAPLHDGPALAGDVLAVRSADIGRQDGEVRLTQDLVHVGDAPVELVVAQGHGVIAHVVHGGHDGVGIIGRLVVQVVGHDGPLDVVAGIHQEGVGALLAHLLDIGVQPGHAVVGGLRVVLVAVAPDIAVHIRGGKDGDGLLPLGGKGGGGQQGHSHHQGQQSGEKLSSVLHRDRFLLL